VTLFDCARDKLFPVRKSTSQIYEPQRRDDIGEACCPHSTVGTLLATAIKFQDAYHSVETPSGDNHTLAGRMVDNGAHARCQGSRDTFCLGSQTLRDRGRKLISRHVDGFISCGRYQFVVPYAFGCAGKLEDKFASASVRVKEYSLTLPKRRKYGTVVTEAKYLHH
jgi:hypothetical protein